MAHAAASVEGSESSTFEYDFNNILDAGQFVPAGRMWAGLGALQQLTPYNCYVLAAPEDSLEGISNTCLRMMKIMSRGGGVGIPVMSLRPRYSVARSSNGRSSGSVSWSNQFSTSTGLIEQGGSRRGRTDDHSVRLASGHRRVRQCPKRDKSTSSSVTATSR